MQSTTQTNSAQTSSTDTQFELIETQHIDTLQVDISSYRHKKTHAMHYHLSCDNEENVFMVAFRTLPQDSTGVAHILEHTALCGSQRFPVRDPFFMMIRRSLNTFMNAFTSSDWTAYPFATQNNKDFDHLLQVYLDAAFFSRLDPLDFAQEGHRLAFDGDELVYKGVVYNEMKGAMSNINSYLWQEVSKHLQIGTTYQYNSGGDPIDIPSLTHDALTNFYRTHYHPSNAVFMTFGNIPAAQHQQRIEALVLDQFEAQENTIRAQTQQRFSEPKQAIESYPYSAQDNEEKDQAKLEQTKSFLLLSWLWGQSYKLEDVLLAQLISGVLLENSASPLQHFLETTDLGTSPSSLCGMDNSSKEIVFMCGLEGSDCNDAQAFEDKVLKLFEDICANGVDSSLAESVLHQIELGQREITGTSYPYGLSLMLTALPGALHDGNPFALLDIDQALNELRSSIQDPAFLASKIKALLIDNPHRLRIAIKPDLELQQQKDQAEKDRLADINTQLSDDEKSNIIDLNKALDERQKQVDDPNILPKLNLSDVPQNTAYPQPQSLSDSIDGYAQATNGLVYQDLRIALPELTQEQYALLPILTSCLTELGAGSSDYMQFQNDQSAYTGGMSAFYQVRDDVNGQPKAYWGISGKALQRNHEKLTELQLASLYEARFDETQRIRELIQQIRSSVEKSVTSNGHSLTMLAASSAHKSMANLAHQLKGLSGIKHVKQLDDALAEPEKLNEFCQQLSALYQYICNANFQAVVISEQQYLQDNVQLLQSKQNKHEATHTINAPQQLGVKKQLWLTQTQVNFCSKAYPSVSLGHPDAPVLTVLSSFLRNGYLHRTIREQGGAYGGGASQDNQLGIFKFYSYRDPRLSETLQDFDNSIAWLLEESHDTQALEEAIFTVISSIDKPSSPAGEARQDFNSQLFGISQQQRAAFRKAVLSVTVDDLKRVTEKYLGDSNDASQAVITSRADDETQQALIEQGFEIFTL